MKIIRKILSAAVCVIVGMGIVIGYQNLSAPKSEPSTERTQIDITTLKESMEANNELSTARYLYTNSITVTDQNDLSAIGLSGVVLPFTDATYVLQYDGEISAGFKLDQADVYMEGDNTVVVSLPPVEILSHSTGEVELVYERQNIANPLHAGEESSWIEDQKTPMEDRARSLGLYDDARENAKVTFETLFAEAIPEGATIDVRFQDES